jgi:hypothetical protein
MPAMTLTTTSVLLAQAASAPPASGARLVAAALIGIALIVLLITRFKLHPFLGLTIGSLVVAASRACRSRRPSPATRRASATPQPASAP